VLDWSPADQLAAATSVADEIEACPGCGLRPDQHHMVEADLDRCPGCEAKAAKHGEVGEHDRGMRIGFYPVDDSRLSVWAQYTQEGRRWLAANRSAPDGLIYDPDKEE